MPIVLNGQEYLTTLEAAKLAGVHSETMRHWIKRGDLAGVLRIGRAWAIPKAAVEQAIVGKQFVYGAPGTAFQPAKLATAKFSAPLIFAEMLNALAPLLRALDDKADGRKGGRECPG